KENIIHVLPNDVIPVSKPHAQRHLKAEPAQRMERAKLRRRYAVAKLCVATAEIHVDLELLSFPDAPMTAELIRLLIPESVQRGADAFPQFRGFNGFHRLRESKRLLGHAARKAAMPINLVRLTAARSIGTLRFDRKGNRALTSPHR